MESNVDFIYCTVHPTKLAKKLCSHPECNVFICNACAIDSHGMHLDKLANINTLYVNNLDVLKKLIQSASTTIKMNSNMTFKCMNFVFHQARCYCRMCKKFICEKCATSHDKSHSILSLNNYFASLQEMIDIFMLIINFNCNSPNSNVQINEPTSSITQIMDQTAHDVLSHKTFIAKTLQQRSNLVYSIMDELHKFYVKKQNIIAKNQQTFKTMQAIYEKIKIERDMIKIYEYFIDFEMIIESVYFDENEKNAVKNVYSKLLELKQQITLANEKLSSEISKSFSKIMEDNMTNLRIVVEKNEDELRRDVCSLLDIKEDEYKRLKCKNNEKESSYEKFEYAPKPILEPVPVKSLKSSFDIDALVPCISIEVNIPALIVSQPQRNQPLIVKQPSLPFQVASLVNTLEILVKPKIMEEKPKPIVDNEKPKPIPTPQPSLPKPIVTPPPIKEKPVPVETKSNKSEEVLSEGFSSDDERKEDQNEKEKEATPTSEKKMSKFETKRTSKVIEAELISFDNKPEITSSAQVFQTRGSSVTICPGMENRTSVSLDIRSQTIVLEPKDIMKKKIDSITSKISQTNQATTDQIKEFLACLTWDERNMIELISLGQNCKSAFVYNPFLNIVEEIEFILKLPACHSFINIQPFVYLTGGKIIEKNSEVNLSCKCRRIGEKQFEFIPLENMNEARSCHTTIYHPRDDCIYAISGTRIKSCERFEISKNKWTTIPSLNSSREKACAAVYNDNLLYVFFGFDRTINKYVTTIEKMNIDQMSSWEVVNISGNQNMLKKQGLSCIPLVEGKKNGVLLIGGVNALRNETREIVFYDFPSNNATLYRSFIPSNNSFTHINFFNLIDNGILFNFTENFTVLKYSIKTASFVS